MHSTRTILCGVLFILGAAIATTSNVGVAAAGPVGHRVEASSVGADTRCPSGHEHDAVTEIGDALVIVRERPVTVVGAAVVTTDGQLS